MENLLFGSQNINYKKKRKSMKEFVMKDGSRVKEGDNIVIPTIVSIDENSIPKLVKDGILTEVKVSSLSIEGYCLEHLAKRIGWNVQNLEKYLDNLYTVYPTAVFSIILRELAIIMDKKYPDHINKSKEIWTISSVNGEITRIKELNKIKNFRNFAAFRNLEDAIEAKEIMKEALADLFKRGGK